MTEDVTQIHIFYTGIIGFHPVRDQQGEVQALWALAPNGRKHPRHLHEIWLACSKNQVVKEDFLSKVGSARGAVAYLVDGDMSLSNQGAEPLELWGGGPDGSDHLVPLTRSHEDIAHSVKLDRAHLGQVNQQKLGWKTKIKKGSLEISYLNREYEWSFSNQNDYRPLAQAVCHSFEVEGDTLAFEFERPSRNDGFLRLVSKKGEPIIVVIGNTLKEDILDPTSTPSNEDHHVKLYNKLAKNPHSSPRALPHLVRRTAPGKPEPGPDLGWLGEFNILVAGGANCPPGWWEESG